MEVNEFNRKIYQYIKDILEHYTEPIYGQVLGFNPSFREIEREKSQGLLIAHDVYIKEIFFVCNEVESLLKNSYINLKLLCNHVNTKNFILYQYLDKKYDDNGLLNQNIKLLSDQICLGLSETFMIYSMIVTNSDNPDRFTNCTDVIYKHINLLTLLLLRTRFNNQDVTSEQLKIGEKGWIIKQAIMNYIKYNYITWLVDYVSSLGFDRAEVEQKANEQVDTTNYQTLIHNLGNGF